ncbi:secretory protein 23C [Emiliania huxleyi CCMP1516]|uniref:Protein transport protein SEC23 n=2 Tax=Emiliania huxleyi TaxID=2903 RepID=A0A0D3KGQ7_EMIH1|nr:secretory protein 23C [Emiliania huxleyi CCMP1516]EOD34942.1 secretory protein 23C [Emiliania huxleyi CCMP1516]|eukprot:XP_005787371.1 secretory protein 23C [Emiliania huxleyi CCMP1516]
MGDFHDVEATDGVRFSWNVWPSSRLEATRIVAIEGLPLLPYEPVMCKGTCPAMLNPYCRIDFKAKIWVCPFCFQRTPPSSMRSPDSLEQVLQLLASAAPTALIGLITFGTVVQVHELGFEHCSKCYTFKGTKDPAPAQLAEQLGAPPHPAAHLPAAFPTAPCPTPTLTPCRAGISAGGAGRGGRAAGQGGPADARSASARFLLPISEAEFAISNVLSELRRDPWPVPSDSRPQRCTGAAASIAVSLLELAFPNTGARDAALLHRRRRSAAVHSCNVKHMKKALKHYAGVAQRASKARHISPCLPMSPHVGHVFDIFACALDQAGGGGGNIFKQSLSQVFARDASGTALRMAFGGGTVEVLTSNEFKVCGAIGNCASLGKKSNNVGETRRAGLSGAISARSRRDLGAAPRAGETEIGLGNTNAWSVGGLDEDTTLALYFEMAAQSGGQQQQQAGGQRYLQLLTSYQHSSGQYRLRVTTLARPWAEAAQAGEMARGFDQEAAAVLMARIASHKTQTEEARSLLRWIDPHRLADLSGWSADLLRRPPVPVLLDVTSIAPDRILLLDTFFHVIVYHGETISAWRKQGYHETAEHQNFRELLSAPKEDAAELLQQRFPVPMYIECDQYGSQARFLLAKLNPSVTHNSSQSGAASSDFLFTDDVSFQVFMDHLKRLAVESK